MAARAVLGYDPEQAVRERLEAAPRGEPLLLIVDLTDEGLGGAALVESLAGGDGRADPADARLLLPR